MRAGEITAGRREPFTATFNRVIDGLFKHGEFDAVAMYLALKRFVDRRACDFDEEGKVMDWSVNSFCQKFGISKDKFYRLVDTLWRYGLVDVVKETLPRGGCKNRYIVHDLPEYEGDVRPYRTGSFRHQTSAKGSTSSRDQVSAARKDAELEPKGCGDPENHCPETEIPETGIPEIGIPEIGIPVSGTTKRKLLRENITGRKENTGSSSSPYGEEEDRPADNLPNDRALIAELTRKLHSIPGVKKLSGHYSLIGRAYKEYGYGVVAQALEDVEFVLLGRRDMGLPDLSERDLAKLLFQKCRWNWKDPNLAKYRDKEEPKVPPDQPYFPEVIDIHEWCRRHGYRVVRDGPCGLVVKVRDEERGEEGVAEDA